jgi:hypothetical protein
LYIELRQVTCSRIDQYFLSQVNLAMLENILKDEDHAFVFFYDEHDTDAFTILEELESIDEKLDKQDLPLVKISDVGSSEAFGIRDTPSLVYFEDGVPEIYAGDLLNDNQVELCVPLTLTNLWLPGQFSVHFV